MGRKRKRRKPKFKRGPKRSVEDRIVRLERKLAALAAYAVGDYGQQLGIKADTQCLVLEAKEDRMYMRKLAVATLPPRPAGAHLCHRCDNRKCYRPSHLFWGTRKDNIRDCVLKGRRKHGRPFVEYKAALERRLVELKERLVNPPTVKLDAAVKQALKQKIKVKKMFAKAYATWQKLGIACPHPPGAEVVSEVPNKFECGICGKQLDELSSKIRSDGVTGE